jgi:hypothetical protein
MYAVFFLVMGIVFCWLIYRAISTREIMGHGWGISTRTYSRDDQPIWYWVTFITYSICAVWAIVFAVLLIRKVLF